MRHKRLSLALVVLILALFLVVGCTGILEGLGMNEQEIQEIKETTLAEVEKTKRAGRTALYEILSTVVAGVGVVTSTFLAKLLAAERRMNKAVIEGVEATNEGSPKAEIHKAAVKAGVEDKLHKRVTALTG